MLKAIIGDWLPLPLPLPAVQAAASAANGDSHTGGGDPGGRRMDARHHAQADAVDRVASLATAHSCVTILFTVITTDALRVP